MITFSCPCNRTWKLQVHCSDLLLFPWVWLNQWSFWKERSILPKPAWPHLPISLILRRKKKRGGFWSKYLKMTTSGPLFCSLVSNLGVFLSPLLFPFSCAYWAGLPVFILFHYSLPLFPNFFPLALRAPFAQSNQPAVNGWDYPTLSVWFPFLSIFLFFWGNERRQKQKLLVLPWPSSSLWSCRNESVEWTV